MSRWRSAPVEGRVLDRRDPGEATGHAEGGLLSVTNDLVLLLAAASCLVAAVVAVAVRPSAGWPWAFSLGMLGFAVEAGAAYMLVTVGQEPESRLLWLRVWQVSGLALLMPWSALVAGLGHAAGGPPARLQRAGLGAAAAMLLAAAAAVLLWPPFAPTDAAASFYAAQIERPGLWAIVAQMLVTVGILGGLEMRLRTLTRVGRWRIKYLLLGLGGIFLVRFFLLSQILLFQVVLVRYFAASAATLTVGAALAAASILRDRGLGADIALSRQAVYRSILVGVLGIYLLAAGGLGWLLNHFGIPAEAFWGSLVVFVSALGLAAVLLSEHVRWRVRDFVSRHFYGSKYDYRALWERFSRRLSSRVAIDELAPELLQVTTDAAGARRSALYVGGEGDDYYLVASLEADRAPQVLPASDALTARLAESGRAIVLDGTEDAADTASRLIGPAFGPGSVAVPVTWEGRLIGLLLVGPERTATPYSREDVEFFTAVGEHAAGVIATAQLSERLARTREFEAFHHLTAFVIHDLKNAISALSLLSQNALANFDDPEFQRDAIKTVSRTVERMKGLLARLTPAHEEAAFRFQPVDLASLALDATRPLDGSGRVSVIKELAPVTPVPGDPEALLRVIQNLVTNAVEAIASDGMVTVKTYEVPGWAVCAVGDTGRGMSREYVRRSLFAPFRSTKRGGWGVGLYQAKGIVEAHGGTIEVASEEGHGSLFTVKLPLRRPAERGANP